jgi:hypothetical protein
MLRQIVEELVPEVKVGLANFGPWALYALLSGKIVPKRSPFEGMPYFINRRHTTDKGPCCRLPEREGPIEKMRQAAPRAQ